MVTKVAEMTSKDPYKDSPYDASGMPLGCETVDYDNQKDVAKATVKDKPYEEPLTFEYDPTVIDVEDEPDKALFNEAVKENVNSAFPVVAEVDFEEILEENAEKPEVVEAVKNTEITDYKPVLEEQKAEAPNKYPKDIS
jgi:hypothetical protein